MTSSRKLRLFLSVAAASSLAGCAAQGPHASRPQAQRAQVSLQRTAAASTRPLDPKAEMTLEQIQPNAALPAPSTQPSAPATLDALQTYAQARAALVDNQRFKAILLLQRAAALDPNSFLIQFDLGKCLLATSPGGTAGDSCIAAFEKAADLSPDHLEAQYELGRQYLNHQQLDKALRRLRWAQLTTEYQDGNHGELEVMTDFFLGRALAQSGYTTAATAQYENLLTRLSTPGFTVHGQADLNWLVHHPELIYGELGELYEKQGRNTAALEAYTLAQKSDPKNVDLAIRVVRLSLSAGQVDAAKARAQQLVADNHASNETLALLQDVYRRLGDPNGVARALGKLHVDHPTDRLLFYALLDELKRIQRTDEAERLLIEATRRSNADPDFTRRLFALYQTRDDVESSMRLLVESLAARPDSLRDIGPLWTELLKPAKGSRLRLATLERMKVPANQEPARLFWVSRLAELWNRDALARAALQQAAALKPAFAPVYRGLVNDYWSRPDWDDHQKADACAQLCHACEEQGNSALAAELRGRCEMQQNDPAAAAKSFALAEAAGNRSPDLQLMRARALQREGNSERAEQLLWRLVSDWPQYEDAYADLFNIYLQRKSVDQAVNVVRKWNEAVPDSVDARLLAATIYGQRGMNDDAQSVYESLFAEQPANADVLRSMEAFYRGRGTLDTFVTMLEAERRRNPENRLAVEELVSIYADQKRPADAQRVLAAARAAVATDPDLLYYVAHLYERIDQKQTAEALLEQVVQLDPRHAGAHNDLGYAWADEGRNLERAEAFVRVAVEEEPDNQSYLDSMAWVEYKRGKFTDARTFLDRAIGPANRPDPVVLDHLGDVLYRLHQPADAVAQWKRSLQRIEESDSEREDLKTLRTVLQTKLKQQEQGHPVDVAPVADGAAVGRSEHAKN